MIAQHLTFRDRKLIDAFRQCDERGKALVERIAKDQAKLASSTAMPKLQRVK